MATPRFAIQMAAAVLAIVSVVAQAFGGEKERTGMVPQIVTTLTDGGLQVTGRVLAVSSGAGSAKMSIEKNGPSGRTSTTQGGSFDLEKGEHRDIATVGLSFSPGDKLSIELVLTADGQTLSSAKVEMR
ncbi:MAG: curli-like amyloid fiber formation chaperone CsgH [Pseudomonadota bacterium]|nr:curli-like amyloid fiber formation chaperone CsgH [Pseudomonadota bacterium]